MVYLWNDYETCLCVGKLHWRLPTGRVPSLFPYIKGKAERVQCGLMPGAGYANQIFALQQHVEKCTNVIKFIACSLI